MPSKDYIKTSLTEMADSRLPVVALVGRPNVGKSTLFNRLTRSRRAIIDPTPGMTRDRIYGSVDRDGLRFRLADTGGIEPSPDIIARMIRGQTDRAIEEAVLTVLITDGRAGLTPGDEEIAAALRQAGKDTVLFVNKHDQPDEPLKDTAVYALGFETVLTGSAEHGLGMEALFEEIDRRLSLLPQEREESETSGPVRLAIIGRPNAGKSSLVNKLLREERVMVSEVPGTTRDPVDSFLSYRGKNFCLVDTAGIRKRGSIQGSQERLSVMMAQRQVANADVVVVMLDATDPGTAQDAAVAGIAQKAMKPVIVAVNKWDLIEDKQTGTVKDFESRIRRRLKFMETNPFVFVSAKTGQRVTRILDLAADLAARMAQRVTTGVLNRFVEGLRKNARFPSHKGKVFKIFYITQVSTAPPTFVATVNVGDGVYFSQERFLVNRIREAFQLEGIPIKLIFKSRSESSSRG